MMNDALKAHAGDVYLDAVRIVEAILHNDGDAYNAVVMTTTAKPTEIVLALATILACAADAHDDPDAAIRELRRLMMNAVVAS